MKLVLKWIFLTSLLVIFSNCNNGPSEADLRLIKEGQTARLINQPDPEEVRMQAFIEQYDTFIAHKFEELDLPGLAYAIVKDGEVISVRTYGVQEKGEEGLIDEHTVFRLASISKGFAATLAGLLVDQNYIGWDDTVSTHLPKFQLRSSSQTDGVTIRHTLSHTTGLKEYSGASLIYKDLSCASILYGLKNAKIEAKPAKVFAYQNAIFSAISEVGKSTTGLSYGSLLDSMIFNPLGMMDASSSYKSIMANDNRAIPHTFSSKKGWSSVDIRKKWYNVGPAAGVNASITDMAIWLQAMLGHRPNVIPESVLGEIFKPHIPINDDSKYYETWAPGLSDAYYGLGWRIFNYKKHKIVYHGGFVRGYRPEMGFCPNEDVGIVLLTNASKNELSTICVHAFFEMYFSPRVTR